MGKLSLLRHMLLSIEFQSASGGTSCHQGRVLKRAILGGLHHEYRPEKGSLAMDRYSIAEDKEVLAAIPLPPTR